MESVEHVMPAILDKYLHHNANDLTKISEVLNQGQISGTADIVGMYERALAHAFDAPFAIAVSSGSTAIQTAMLVLGAGPDSEVLVPALAPLPSVFPITLNGARLVPVDVRPNSLDFDPKDLKRKITPQTRAAMVVPLWGYPIDLTETLSILANAGIPLVEDAAHAHGSRIANQNVGTFGAIGCFSTHDRKLLSTGEGGFLLTKDAGLAERLQAHTRLGNLRGIEVGANYKLNALAAALGMARLPDLSELIASRQANATAILNALQANSNIAELSIPRNGAPNYYNLTMLLRGRDGMDARQILEELNRAGITIDQVKYGYDVFYRRAVYSSLNSACLNAESMINRLIQLPVHPSITQGDIDRMITIIQTVEL